MENSSESDGNDCSCCKTTGNVHVLLTELHEPDSNWTTGGSPQILHLLPDGNTNSPPVHSDDAQSYCTLQSW